MFALLDRRVVEHCLDRRSAAVITECVTLTLVLKDKDQLSEISLAVVLVQCTSTL